MLVHHPSHVSCCLLGVRWLPVQAGAFLIEGTCVGTLPCQFPTNRCRAPAHGGQISLRPAEFRLGPHHFLQVALVLGPKQSARGLSILQIPFHIREPEMCALLGGNESRPPRA